MKFRLLAPSFRGSRLKSLWGLEDEQEVLEPLRNSERICVWPTTDTVRRGRWLRSDRDIDFRQPLGEPAFYLAKRGVGCQVLPLVRIGLQIVKLLRVVGVKM